MGWCNPCPPGVPAGNFHLSLSWQAPASHCSPRNEAEKRGGQFRRPRGGVLVSCCCVANHQGLVVFARGFCRSAVCSGSTGTANLCFGIWEPQLRRRQGLGCEISRLGSAGTRGRSSFVRPSSVWWPGPKGEQKKRADLEVMYKITLPGS